MYAVALLGVGAAVCVLVSYNRLTAARVRVLNAWSDMETQFARRYELAEKLMDCCASRMSCDSNTLRALIEARSAALESAGHTEREAAESGFGAALRMLLASAESCPEFTTDFDFRNLRSLLVSLENHISCARRCYNAAARRFNERRETFPALLVARWTGMRQFAQFQLDDQECRPMPRVLKAA